MPPGNDANLPMSDHDHANNAELRGLIELSSLRSAPALTIFNRGRRDPVMTSAWEAWIAHPGSQKWRPLPDEELAHARAVFGRSSGASDGMVRG